MHLKEIFLGISCHLELIISLLFGISNTIFFFSSKLLPKVLRIVQCLEFLVGLLSLFGNNFVLIFNVSVQISTVIAYLIININH